MIGTMNNGKKIRVLITGAGSGVAQGIIKALRISELPLTLIMSDINPVNSGLYRADEAIILPKSETSNSFPIICQALKEAQIDILMVGSEFDLKFFAAHREAIQKETGTFVIASPLETVSIAEDKWLTAEFLKKNGLPFAEAFLAENVDAAAEKGNSWGYPFVLKTRVGTSSRHVHVVKSEKDLRLLYANVPSPMLQKMINLPTAHVQSEFTCSVF